LTCSGGGTGDCLTCGGDTPFHNPQDGEATYSCDAACDSDKYETTTAFMCEECPEFCTACNWDAGEADVVCTECETGYKTLEGACVSNCPDTFYLDGESCISCEDANCDTCSGSGTSVCTACSDTL
jgi:hypothetical protein